MERYIFAVEAMIDVEGFNKDTRSAVSPTPLEDIVQTAAHA
jgi:hypothetical protein